MACTGNTPDVQTSSSTPDPAIFIPFKGFYPRPPTNLDPREKLEKTIENVTAQQEIVRGNMVFLAQKQAEKLVSKAREELSMTKYDDDVEDELARKKSREEVDPFFESLKIPAKQGAKSHDFELKFSREENANGTTKHATNGEVEMGGMDTDTLSISKDRPPRLIRKDLNTSLQSLITNTTHKLEAYDTLSTETLNHYNQAISRRSNRVGLDPTSHKESPVKPSIVKFAGVEKPAAVKGTPTKASTSVQGILKKRTGQSGESPRSPKTRSPRSQIDSTRRMSTEMPISKLKPVTEPVRAVESMEDLARRGSK